jgi:hypothetical protein
MLRPNEMDGIYVFVFAALALVVGFQAWLTRRVFRSSLYDDAQKRNQARLIWLLPIVGATLVFTLLAEDERVERGHVDRSEKS